VVLQIFRGAAAGGRFINARTAVRAYDGVVLWMGAGRAPGATSQKPVLFLFTQKVKFEKNIRMITKTQLIHSLENLPENLTVDQVIDHIVLMEKIQKGLDDAANARVNTREEARKKLSKWLK
jgi:hypothetical protein